jgi:hypothetical protein
VRYYHFWSNVYYYLVWKKEKKNEKYQFVIDRLLTKKIN